MSEQYLDILEQSLHKKIEVLDEIISKNEEQKVILDAEEFDLDAFDENTEAKSGLIDRLNLLDSGFEKVYERVKDELAGNKDIHAQQIKKLQDLIRDITEKSVFIQTMEQHNRSLVEAKFRKEREKIQLGKSSMRVAKQYYNNMNGLSTSEAYFLDSKK